MQRDDDVDQAKAAVAAGHDDAMMTSYYSSTRQTEVWFGQARPVR
jgi:hypothetical protein